MDSLYFTNTNADVVKLIPTLNNEVISSFKLSDEETLFVLECIRMAENGLSDHPIDSKKFKFLNAKIQDIKLSESSKFSAELIQEAKEAVKYFLFPFISNQITSEEEAKRTIPFLNIIIEQLCEKHEVNKENKKFHHLVLSLYIAEGVRGLYTNQHIAVENRIPGQKREPKAPEPIQVYLKLSDYETETIDVKYYELQKWYRDWDKNSRTPLFTKQALILFHALVPALKKDFPNIILSVEDTIYLTLKQLDAVNESRNIEHENHSKDMALIKWKASICQNEIIPKYEIIKKLDEIKFLKKYFSEEIQSLPLESRVMYLSELPSKQQEILSNNSEYAVFLESYQTWVNDAELREKQPAPKIINIIKDAIYIMKFKLGRKKLLLNSAEIMKIAEDVFNLC